MQITILSLQPMFEGRQPGLTLTRWAGPYMEREESDDQVISTEKIGEGQIFQGDCILIISAWEIVFLSEGWGWGIISVRKVAGDSSASVH